MATCEAVDVILPADDSMIELGDIKNDLQKIAAKFERDVTITADLDLVVDLTEVVRQDSDWSNSGSVKENDEHYDSYDDSVQNKNLIKNGDIININKCLNNGIIDDSKKHLRSKVPSSKVKKVERDRSTDSSDTHNIKSKHGCTPVKGKNPVKMLKKLTKFDKSRKKSTLRSDFTVAYVDRLPQVFVVKYLGQREVNGVTGLHHVRKPVDELVSAMKAKLKAKEEVNLPLLYVIISLKGLDLREHQANKVTSTAPTGVLPIDLISYGVQDIKYWRIFTCIIVRSLSWQSKSATCHAFLCDSAHSGRKMALSLGIAFNVCSKKRQTNEKSSTFKIELRPPDELVEEMQECDA